MTSGEAHQVNEQLADTQERLTNITRFLEDDDEQWDDELDELEHALDLVAKVRRTAGWLE